jgi:hypothetical protein
MSHDNSVALGEILCKHERGSTFFLIVNTYTVIMARVTDDAAVSEWGCGISISLEGPVLNDCALSWVGLL